MTGPPYILYIPEIALEKVFSFLSYDEVAKNRMVCKKFNEVGSKYLSRGFIQLEKRHASVYKRFKSLLPRRESERRMHPLAKHCDILQAVETRISMLNMTYNKFINSNMLCFIPGKILDELQNVLALVQIEKTPLRTNHILQELRDLSSMAMEHFDEHILPRVKEQATRVSTLSYGSSVSGIKSPRLIQAHNSFSNEIRKVKKQSKTNKHNISYLSQSTQKLFEKLRKQNRRIQTQNEKLREQEKKIQEQTAKIQQQEAVFADIQKHMEEWDQKYKDLTTELVRAREDLMSSSSTAQKPIRSQTPLEKFSSSKIVNRIIKTRVVHALPKTYNRLDLHSATKRKLVLPHVVPVKRNKVKTDVGESVKIVQDLLNLNKNVDGISSEGTSMASSLRNLEQTIEAFRNNPLSSINSRKRKISEDIDLQ